MSVATTETSITDGHFFDLMYANYGNPRFRSDKVFAFIRKYANEAVFVLANFDTVNHMTDTCVPGHAFDFLNMSEGEFKAVELLTKRQLQIMLRRDGVFSCDIPSQSAVMLKLTF